jgi:hypothetical protein
MTEYNTFYTCNLFYINYLELIQVITNSGSYGYLTICIVRERSSALVCVYIYCIAMRKMVMLKKHSGEAEKEW